MTMRPGKYIHRISATLTAILLFLTTFGFPSDAGAQSRGGKKQNTQVTGGKRKSSSGKPGNKKTGSTGSKKKVPVSSAELKKQQKTLQAEVNATKEEIRRNEASIKKGLSELAKLEEGITASKKETEALGKEVRKLTSSISSLEQKIAAHTRELDRLRSEYLKAVKKMRISKKGNSTLAYLFSSENFAQAERRMRYMKEFSEWKDAKTKEIGSKVDLLRKENEQLKAAKADKDVILGRELKAQQRLASQKKSQDAVVENLKANGEALNAHLARKQAEVNQLRNQVAAVIAEEQRKAEEARKAEERRLAEEARKAEERRLAEEARRDEEARKEEERLKEEQSKTIAENKRDDSRKKGDQRKSGDTQKKNDKISGKKKEAGKDDQKGNYASARKRKSRDGGRSGADNREASNSGKAKPSESSRKNSVRGEDFASFRGNLPRPVAGSWRVVSQFGRHSLPDLPDVTYDNPGIDAEVAKGASAQSVFGGTVSGVYMLPGFSTVVIVNHGEYYTVYGNIAAASVKVGDRVTQGQSVGKLTVDPDNPGHSEIHFEVWKGREKQNPSSWIR